MANPPKAKSQWDFGELFAPEAVQPAAPSQSAPTASAARTVLSVGELTAQVKRLLEKQVGQVWVTGEVTNFRAQSSGHLYFTLKDADSQVNCVLFRGEARDSRDLLADGRRVLLSGMLTVYEPRGQYQLRVVAVELQGIGALQVAFEKLKQKLSAEGLFAAERKRPLPLYPQRIGLVTSATGAAIRDVLHVVQRRHPGLEIILVACRVQGQGAAEEIAEAIKLLNHSALLGPPKLRSDGGRTPHSALDLILVTRGGGSLEDLWAFNEEVVARAIFESVLPVVSAVGHEIDFTISDFVADVRAATPSAAAEIITEGVFASGRFLEAVGERIRFLFHQRWEDKALELEQCLSRLARVHPRERLNEWLQRLDDLSGSLGRCGKQTLRDRRLAWTYLRERLSRVRPALALQQRKQSVTLHSKRLDELFRQRLSREKKAVAALTAHLRLLGPEQVLARGYSITMDAQTGAVIRTASSVKPGQKLRTRLKSGEVESVATKGQT